MHNGATSLAAPRRAQSKLFTERVMVGRALDVGGGPDPLDDKIFPRLTSVEVYDLPRDGTLLADIADESFDVVYSSHCLEHLDDPYTAVMNWYRVLKRRGYLVIVVPDEILYERGFWPSRRNSGHKTRWTTRPEMCSLLGVYPGDSVCLYQAVEERGARVLSYQLLDDGYNALHPGDQTADGSCECGIEIVVRKEVA